MIPMWGLAIQTPLYYKEQQMTLQEIKASCLSGKTVHWTNKSYRVIKDSKNQWFILHDGGNCIGLTWADDKTLNGREEDFYMGVTK